MNYGATVKNSATRAGDILNGMIETQLALLDSYAEKKSNERQEQGNLVLLLVLATGALISAVALALSLRFSKNFDRFRQSKRDSDKKTGSGLGLAICAAIIKDHSGTLGVDTNNGKGSTFWFRIPLAKK